MIDTFLEGVVAQIDEHRGSGVDPPSLAWIPAILIVETIEVALAPIPGTVSRDGLWFIVMTFLEARHRPRLWSELNIDAASWLRWMFKDSEGYDEWRDDLSPRELVALYLYERAGRAPDWFQPMPEA